MKTILLNALPAILILATGCTTSHLEHKENAMEPISYNATLDMDFDDAIEEVTQALKNEGFGIISRIDMHTTFKQKIDRDIPPHTILGACNPVLAHKAVTAMPEASLMLPCNVTVQAEGDAVVVRIVSPEAMMAAAGMDDNPVLQEVGNEANVRLKRVAYSLNN